jgi:two-component system, NtrC family, sensor histidine kinase HydH
VVTSRRRRTEKAGTDRLKVALIAVLILVVSALHFGTSTDFRYLHEIYQRVYYIPILLAAFWYGPFAGLLAAFLVSAIYVLHIRWDWHHVPVYTFNQYAEIFLYHGVALIIGLLSFRERRQREKLEATSRELSDAYARLQTTFEQLRRADRLAALGELSAGVAHEIRNPLSSVKGSVEILEPEFPADHPKREFIEIIKEETERLNKIVSEFLKFARPPEPSVEPASINAILEATLTLIQNETEKAGIRVRADLDPDLPPLTVDPNQIRQVFLNVLFNAIQAMPAGGRLEVCTRSRPSAGSVRVEVTDTGCGADPSMLERMFDPFFSTKAEGTGLGLSISHQLVEKHGGRISAHRNDETGGLTLRIDLPIGRTTPDATP